MRGSSRSRRPNGILLIGPRSGRTIARLHAMRRILGGSPHPPDAFWIERCVVHDPDAVRRLRLIYPRLDPNQPVYQLSDRQLVAAVAGAASRDEIFVLLLPHAPMPTTLPQFAGTGPSGVLSRVASLNSPIATAGTPASRLVALSSTEKIEEALRRTAPRLGGSLREAFLTLLSPASIATTVGAFVVLTAAQAVGMGEVADAALAAVAYTIAGLSGLTALCDMVIATAEATRATTSAELDVVADRYARDFTVLGVAFLSALSHACGAHPQCDGRGEGGRTSDSSGQWYDNHPSRVQGFPRRGRRF